MSIRSVLSEAENTRLLVLTSEDKPYAMRACIYSLETYSFAYYDFLLANVKNTSQQRFIKNNGKLFERVPLISTGSGVLYTQDELDGKVVAQEFKDDAEVERLLGYVISVLKEQSFYRKRVNSNG